MRKRLTKTKRTRKLVSSTTLAVRKDPTVLSRIKSYVPSPRKKVCKKELHDSMWKEIQDATHLLTI